MRNRNSVRGEGTWKEAANAPLSRWCRPLEINLLEQERVSVSLHGPKPPSCQAHESEPRLCQSPKKGHASASLTQLVEGLESEQPTRGVHKAQPAEGGGCGHCLLTPPGSSHSCLENREGGSWVRGLQGKSSGERRERELSFASNSPLETNLRELLKIQKRDWPFFGPSLRNSWPRPLPHLPHRT